MSNITTLFFDLGGVCLTNGWDHTVRQKAAEHFSYNYSDSEERHQQVVEDFECGRISIEDYMEKAVFFQERSFSQEDYIRFMKEQTQPFEDSLHVLEKLAEQKKYRLATINNESLALNLYRINTFHLDKYFSAFFSSCFLGVMKPDCLIFRRALWITRRTGEECLFIDDRIENVAAAKECGIGAIHLKKPEDLTEVLKHQGISF